MKILLVSTDDVKGGAAIATWRLHQGLLNKGINSELFVMRKSSDDKSVINSVSKTDRGEFFYRSLMPAIDRLPLKIFYKNRDRSIFWSSNWFPNSAVKELNLRRGDLVHLNWIGCGFLDISSLNKINAPLVWTLHDMWPFTGGCHYSVDCIKYMNLCGNCPLLRSNIPWDLSRWIYNRKSGAYKKIKDLTIVSPSKWLASFSKNSSLLKDFPIELIPHGINQHLYKPVGKEIARKILNVPMDMKIILFGAIRATKNKRKGYSLLLSALRELSGQLKDTELFVFGSCGSGEILNIDFKVNYMGFLDDISLVMLYSAADVMVVPSLQEAWGNTVMESLSCGTPVVAFNIGGIPDMVDHQKNGYLATPFDVSDLASGIAWVLNSNEEDYRNLSINARQKVEENFTLDLQVKRYVSLYRKLLDKA